MQTPAPKPTHRHRKQHKVLKVTGGKVAYTNTSRYPDAALELALRALAKDLDIDGVVFHFKALGRRRRTDGRAYPHLPGMANRLGLAHPYRWRYLAIVTDGGGWLGLLDTLAHEAKHTDHYRNGKYRRGTKRNPTRGREDACYAFAAWWVARYPALHKAVA